MLFHRKKIIIVLNILCIIGFFILPYYLFEGKLFIGGDDTRLLYVYPEEWLRYIAFYSWVHFSSVGLDNPNQFALPFVFVWSLLHKIIQSKVVLDYLSFSLPLVLGFVFFQKLVGELIENKERKYNFIFFIGALFYTLSPILATNQLSIFLYIAWLIGLLPISLYYFIKYIKTGNFLYVFINSLWCVVLSLSISGIPWILGFVLPITVALCITGVVLFRENIWLFIKRTAIFAAVLLLSQSFWLYSFLMNALFKQDNSFVATALSQQIKDTFASTVLPTATGNIMYPLFNLFHRQLSVDYESQLKGIFFSFYDKIIIVDALFVIVLFLALFSFKKYLDKKEKKVYLIFLIAFLLSLFFFTVNIGPLKNIFLTFGYIPGFAMFRNFYDKFSFGYVVIYSVLITFSLVIVERRFKKLGLFISVMVLGVILFNFVPIKQIIDKPLWRTNDIHTNISFPVEYMDFMKDIKKIVPPTTNILSLPYSIAAYGFVKELGSENTYVGGSPVQMFTGINDFSGNLSFLQPDTSKFVSLLKNRKYPELNEFLVQHNVSYIFITKNVPQQVKQSYLFPEKLLATQDEGFLNAISGKEIMKSTNGNFSLYEAKTKTSLFQSENLTVKKISPVMYTLSFKNVKGPQMLTFLDSYHGGWRLYPQENSSTKELSYLFKQDLYADSHKPIYDYANQWMIDPNILKNNFSNKYYQVNSDGSLDFVLTLYFKPQQNFYIGSLITLLTFIGSISYLFVSRRKK